MLAVAALVGTDERDAGLGSALLSSSQQLGGAVGLAALVNVAAGSSGLGDERTIQALADGISTALVVISIVLAAGALIATTLPALHDSADRRNERTHSINADRRRERIERR